MLYYNSGSKLNELNPAENFVDLTAYPAIKDRLESSFAGAVSVGEGVYGVPMTSSQAGAVLYNKKIYAELGLSVPTTWQQFLDNCAAIKAAGYYGLIGTFGESWTSQVLFLGDYYNVVSGSPDFAAEFQAGTAKYASTPSAVRSFEKYTEVIEYYNEDYMAATYEDGCDYIAEGLGGHWIILTQALGNIYSLYGKEVVDQIGVFGVPSDDGNSGLTVWVANAVYANKNSDNLDAVMKFLEYCMTDAALDTYATALMPYGPFCVTGYQLGDNAFAAVSTDMQAYFDAGTTHVAQEFECAIKGANCESICIEVGSGAITAAEAAQIYDEDCLKMAVQLGFNWE
jgi:raffinose/stachyose/melibiose transport system substrate-binding protein